MAGSPAKNPRSAATANGSSIFTTPTTPASNSWNSRPRKSPAVPNSPARTPAPKNDLPLFSQPISLAPPSLFSRMCGRGLLLSAIRQSSKSRQAPANHRRRDHRFRLHSRRPHRLFRPPQFQNQALRPRTRRHLAARRRGQAPPPSRRPEIHPRQPALQLHRQLFPILRQRPHHSRRASHHHSARRLRQSGRLLPNSSPRRQRKRNPHRQRRQHHSRRRRPFLPPRQRHDKFPLRSRKAAHALLPQSHPSQYQLLQVSSRRPHLPRRFRSSRGIFRHRH